LELSASGYEVHRIGGTGRQAIRASGECHKLNFDAMTAGKRDPTKMNPGGVSPWDKLEYRSFAQEEAPGGAGLLRVCWPSLPIFMGDVLRPVPVLPLTGLRAFQTSCLLCSAPTTPRC
jgi:hypothetical protein